MERTLFKDLSPAERLRALESNCDKIEEESYMKAFSEQDITEFKSDLAKVSIELNDIAIEKAEAVKAFTERAKEPAQRKTEVLKYIKDKAISVKENCYVFFDQDEKMAYYYNGEGDMILSRQLLPKERQKTFFSTLRAEPGSAKPSGGIPGVDDQQATGTHN